jgi:flagellum-specific peptidoglycan hydrolase FlgJ
MPPGSNNPFGIKAVANQNFVESPTREVENNETVTITARFRVFSSLDEAFNEHGRLLATSPRYANARTQSGDPEAFADALNGIYGTDPNYAATLKWVIENYHFLQYDR